MAATAQAFVLTARAKFNMRLEIGAVRADGLHVVRSVVADLVIGDEVTFQPSGGEFSVTCDRPIPQADNLAWRVAQALDTALPALRVHIKKVLPAQAGLGGGSSDAAAVLRGIAAVSMERGITLHKEALVRAASRVGSDIAACLTPGLKLVEGGGETVTPLPAVSLPWGVLLLKPAAGMPTAAAYRILDDARATRDLEQPRRDNGATELCRALARADFARSCALVHNDFQDVIEAAMPEVADARVRLTSAGANTTVLCGSGSCVAGLFASVGAATHALASLSTGPGEWAAATGIAFDG